MKKFLALCVAFVLIATTFASVTVEKPTRKASEVFLPVGKAGEVISLQDLSTISVKDYETISGRDMSIFEKASFKLGQRQLRNSINSDGSFNNKKLAKLAKKVDGSDGFHVGGFALGFLVGLIGVLIAYLINDDKKRNRTKWAWIGFGAAILLYVLLVI